MQTKHLCVLIHICTKCEVGAVPSSKNIFTDRSKAVLLLWIIFVIYVSCLSCCLVCSMQPCGHLLGKGEALGSCVWSFVMFFTFPVVSWVKCVLYCIDS